MKKSPVISSLLDKLNDIDRKMKNDPGNKSLIAEKNLVIGQIISEDGSDG